MPNKLERLLSELDKMLADDKWLSELTSLQGKKMGIFYQEMHDYFIHFRSENLSLKTMKGHLALLNKGFTFIEQQMATLFESEKIHSRHIKSILQQIESIYDLTKALPNWQRHLDKQLSQTIETATLLTNIYNKMALNLKTHQHSQQAITNSLSDFETLYKIANELSHTLNEIKPFGADFFSDEGNKAVQDNLQSLAFITKSISSLHPSLANQSAKSKSKSKSVKWDNTTSDNEFNPKRRGSNVTQLSDEKKQELKKALHPDALEDKNRLFSSKKHDDEKNPTPDLNKKPKL